LHLVENILEEQRGSEISGLSLILGILIGWVVTVYSLILNTILEERLQKRRTPNPKQNAK